MKRQWLALSALLSFGLLFAPPPALAEGDEDPGTGLGRISLSQEWAIPYRDGERWEQHAFEKAGKLLLIEGLQRSESYTFEIRPSDDGYAPVTIEIGPKCWKLKKVKRGLREWRCEKRAKFKKLKVKKPEPPKDDKPSVDEDDDIPPMPGVPPPPPPKDDE